MRGPACRRWCGRCWAASSAAARAPEHQDLCQEVFLGFFARIGELRDPKALRNFLIGICLGVAHNELRRSKTHRWMLLTSTGELPGDSDRPGRLGSAARSSRVCIA